MSEPRAKCAWCGKEPYVYTEPNRITCVNSSGDCVFAYFWDVYSDPASWNKKQERILAHRRKDFEAGWLKSHPVLSFVKAFDDYIKGER